MSPGEHRKQAELILRETEQALPVAQTQREIQTIDIQVQMAQAHALLAGKVE